MTANTSNTTAHVKLRSREPLTENEPAICSIGGFSVDTGAPEVIAFDWESSAGYKDQDSAGHFIIEWNLSQFDSQHFLDTNPDLDAPDWAKIVQADLDEVFYEAGEDGDEQRVAMDVVEFTITESTDDKDIEHAFTQKQLDKYNSMIAARRES